MVPIPTATVVFYDHSKELYEGQADPFECILCLNGVASVQFKAMTSICGNVMK